MKRYTIVKTAKALIAAMIISAFLPMIAFAAVGYEPFEYDNKNRSVTASVYFTEGEADQGDTVTLNVYDKEGNLVNDIETVFDRVDDVTGAVYFKFEYNFRDLNGNVIDDVYFGYDENFSSIANRPKGSSGGGGGGGGGWFPPPVNNDDDTIQVFGSSVNARDLEAAFSKHSHVTLVLNRDEVTIPAAVLMANKDKSLTIQADDGTYTLPLSALDYESLAEELSASAAELSIKVSISTLNGNALQAVGEAIAEAGGELIGQAVDFTITAVSGSQSVTVEDFGDTYVERTISASDDVDPNTATGAIFDEASGTMRFVPSVFDKQNGRTIVTIKSKTNSVYAIVEKEQAYSDVPEAHWAAEDIAVLTSKLIVHGVSDDKFDLSRNVTRAEFAGLLVRSLGLNVAADSSSNFSDVESDKWYAGEVAAAADAGLVHGYPDGTFRPNDVISRQELAAMVVRAMAIAGKDTSSIIGNNAASILSQFNDADQVGTWAQAELAIAVKSNIVYGMGNAQLSPRSNATRAEAAAMIYRYLQAVTFINK